MVSAWLAPLQAGSWLMSIFAPLGAVPSNFTTPLMDATVAGSIGVGGAAGAAFSSVVLEACSVFSFLLQPTRTPKTKNAPRVIANILLRFIASPFRRIYRLWLFRSFIGHSTSNRR